MQVRAGHPPAGADGPEDFALFDRLTGAHVDAREMHVGGDQPLAVVDEDGVAVEEIVAGIDNDTGNYFFNGNSVFIDHGQGLISIYMHLSRIDVGNGQRVARGERIGAVGATGRSTGPHLHWTVLLNDVAVDPEFFLKTR